MKIVFSLFMLFNLMFMMTKHPVSMGCVLLIQTILASLLYSMNMKLYLFSYILFLIFVGGMLILFMYMSSIASNEKFYSLNLMLLMVMYMISMFIIMKMPKMISDSFFNNNVMSLNPYISFMMDKLYSFPTGMLTLTIVVYLFFTLIVVSNIVGIKFSPLRSYN
uniref:NADH-ubiquinone oxidoreductase chain 6 n=1 Tax=Chonosia atrodorsalis TaxID=2219931 RepID=A0A3Q8GR08_9HEMI|nr:NADH dehydrogenase subunit 6 [Chonosia atrodorsalis]